MHGMDNISAEFSWVWKVVILGANLGHRLHPLQHYQYKETNKQKIGLDIVMDYIEDVSKQIYIEMFVSRTKWQMQSGVKSGANTLYKVLRHKISHMVV